MPIGSSLFTSKYTLNSLDEGRRGAVPAYEEADSGEVVAQLSISFPFGLPEDSTKVGCFNFSYQKPEDT